jgi:hypothetical protein
MVSIMKKGHGDKGQKKILHMDLYMLFFLHLIISVSDGFDVAWVVIIVGFLSTSLHVVPHTQVVKTCYKL